MYYTSYFDNLKHIDSTKYILVSIINKKPNFCSNLVIDWSILGPTKSLIYAYKNGEIDEKEYTKIYLNYLNSNWDKFRLFFEDSWFKKQDIVMLCYEKPSKFCHRHLLCDFLNAKGIKCKELDCVI